MCFVVKPLYQKGWRVFNFHLTLQSANITKEDNSMPIKKGTMPPRYDEAFKAGAVKMVTEQGRSVKEVASELGICIDTLRSWLKRAGFQPSSLTRQNREDARLRELEAENRALRKRLAEKDEVIAVLKKSIGILSVP